MSQITADFDKRNELENETLKNLQKKIDEKKGQIQKLES